MRFMPQEIDVEYLKWIGKNARKCFNDNEYVLYAHGTITDITDTVNRIKKDAYADIKTCIEQFRASDGQTADVHLVYVYREEWVN